jgi:hypothetical protein
MIQHALLQTWLGLHQARSVEIFATQISSCGSCWAMCAANCCGSWQLVASSPLSAGVALHVLLCSARAVQDLSVPFKATCQCWPWQSGVICRHSALKIVAATLADLLQLAVQLRNDGDSVRGCDACAVVCVLCS